MGRNKTLEPKVPLYVEILEAQDNELRAICSQLGINKTDAVGEALQYWLAAQRKMLEASGKVVI